MNRQRLRPKRCTESKNSFAFALALQRFPVHKPSRCAEPQSCHNGAGAIPPADALELRFSGILTLPADLCVIKFLPPEIYWKGTTNVRDKWKKGEEISVKPIMDQPETADELINKYGTYNIQPTADSGNRFPAIAQGFPHEPEKQKKKPPES